VDQWTSTVYDYLRTLGDPGDEVRTEVRPWLQREHGLTHREAAPIRARSMKSLKELGLVQRINVRGPVRSHPRLNEQISTATGGDRCQEVAGLRLSQATSDRLRRWARSSLRTHLGSGLRPTRRRRRIEFARLEQLANS